MWFKQKPKTGLSGCIAMFMLFGMAAVGFITLIIMAIIEALYS